MPQGTNLEPSKNRRPKERLAVKARRKKKKGAAEVSFEETRLERVIKDEEAGFEVEKTMEFGEKMGLKRKESKEAL